MKKEHRESDSFMKTKTILAGLRRALVVIGLVLGCRLTSGANVELDSPSTPAGYVSLLLINEVPINSNNETNYKGRKVP